MPRSALGRLLKRAGASCWLGLTTQVTSTRPLIALLYAVMTADSARRHYAGRGGEWKGRVIPAGGRPAN